MMRIVRESLGGRMRWQSNLVSRLATMQSEHLRSIKPILIRFARNCEPTSHNSLYLSYLVVELIIALKIEPHYNRCRSTQMAKQCDLGTVVLHYISSIACS